MTEYPYEGEIAILYARVSTDDKGQNPQTQVEIMKRWCERQKVTIANNGIYIEELSAKDLNRPKFQEAMGRITMGDEPISIFLTLEESRVSRNLNDLTKIQKLLSEKRCKMRFAGKDVAPETDEGKLMTVIGGWAAEAERNKIKIRTKQGMQQKRAEGKHMGRVCVIAFAEDVDNKEMYPREGMIRLDGSTKHNTIIVRERDVYNWAMEGYSVERMAKELLYVPYSTFYKLLKETGRLSKVQSLKGCYQGGTINKGNEPPTNDVNKGYDE